MPDLDLRRVPYDHPDVTALIERLQRVYVDRYGNRDDDPTTAAMFVPPEGSFFVGYLDGEPVASGAWRRAGVSALGTGRTAEIKRMYVVEEHQGAGLARRMLAHLERTAADAGYEALVLSTGDLQPEAVALYRSSGYEAIRPFGFYEHGERVVCFGRRIRTDEAVEMSMAEQ